MKTTRLLLLVPALLLLLVPSASGYQAALKADVSRTEVAKGETFTYTLSITEEGEADKQATLEPLDFGVFRVSGTFSSSNVKMIQGKARRVTEQEFRLSTDRPGSHVIPPAVLTLLDTRTGERQQMTSNEVVVVVSDEEKGALEGIAEDIRDIKEPKTFMDRVKLYFYSVVALIVIAFLILVGFAFYMVSKRKAKAPAAAPAAPSMSARQAALAAIDEAEAHRSDTARFYTLITDAVRRYVSTVHGIHTMEATTSEIMAQAKTMKLPPASLELLGSLLMESDMVKFAKYVPDEPEKGAFADKARKVIEEL